MGRQFSLFLLLTCLPFTILAAQEKDAPALDPFGPREIVREDAVPGYLELSDGTIRPGKIFLTRDHRLKIFDPKLERQREIPLSAIRRIDCKIAKEWLEKEWRFKENANDEKVYTGKSYPSREYVHVITLLDGRKIEGDLAALVYLVGEKSDGPERFLLHKRHKGEVGATLRKLIFVKSLCLGEKALEVGKDKIARKKTEKKTSQK